jgi:hypothetical protein
MVGDSDAMGVAAEVTHDVLGSAEGSPYIAGASGTMQAGMRSISASTSSSM